MNRCAVPWYRVEPFSRLQPAVENGADPLGFEIGPAFINPNRAEVVESILKEFEHSTLDEQWQEVAEWYRIHQRLRCRQWDFTLGDLG